MKTILIVDGICTRGLAVIRYLSSTGEYHILVFARDPTCLGATAVSSLPNVTLLLNRCSTGYDLSTFIAATQRCPMVLICSDAANSESREGLQWGMRLVQSAASAGAKHLLYLTAERERKQCNTDNYINGQSKTPMAWTIIRSCLADVLASSPGSELSFPTHQLRNLAYYVGWTFSNPERSSGLDFVIPTSPEPGSASANAETSKRRDSRLESAASPIRPQYRVEGVQPQVASEHSRSSLSTARPGPSRSSSGPGQASYLDSRAARVIRKWVATTSPAPRSNAQDSEDDGDDEDFEGASGSETE